METVIVIGCLLKDQATCLSQAHSCLDKYTFRHTDTEAGDQTSSSIYGTLTSGLPVLALNTEHQAPGRTEYQFLTHFLPQPENLGHDWNSSLRFLASCERLSELTEEM